MNHLDMNVCSELSSHHTYNNGLFCHFTTHTMACSSFQNTYNDIYIILDDRF